MQSLLTLRANIWHSPINVCDIEPFRWYSVAFVVHSGIAWLSAGSFPNIWCVFSLVVPNLPTVKGKQNHFCFHLFCVLFSHRACSTPSPGIYCTPRWPSSMFLIITMTTCTGARPTLAGSRVTLTSRTARWRTELRVSWWVQGGLCQNTHVKLKVQGPSVVLCNVLCVPRIYLVGDIFGTTF